MNKAGTAMAIISGLLQLFITLPIWYFLLYSILQAIHPDRLVWFLFWLYIPAHVLAALLAAVTKRMSGEV